MIKSYFLLLLTLCTLNSWSQDIVNQYDDANLRHGIWRKYFDKTKQLRYEGQFDHGKEVGTFKFYTMNKGVSVLSATKQFNPDNDIAQVTFMSSQGHRISEGTMNRKLFVGKWVFYHKDGIAIMSTELYNDSGELEGQKQVFYRSGAVAETSNYEKGMLNGPSLWYAENGTLLKAFTYKNDELHGVSKYYDNAGNLEAEGAYRNDLKHGVWSYYKDGVLVETKDHTKRSKNPKKQ